MYENLVYSNQYFLSLTGRPNGLRPFSGAPQESERKASSKTHKQKDTERI